MKKLIFNLFLVVMFCICFSACQSHDFDTDYNEYKYQTFVADFNNTFDVSASDYANHQWGTNLIQFVKPTITRSHDVNGNLWYQNWVRPINVGDEVSDEVETVVTEFSKVRENTVNAINVNWNNYWVQQVYTGTQTYIAGNGGSIGTGSSHMNHLLAYNEEGIKTIVYEQWNNWQGGEVINHYEHINNFNSGSNNTIYTDDITSQDFIGTTLMKNMGNTPSGTPKFGYHNSTDSKDHFEYIIIPGSEIFPNNPEMHKYYYVGFDFYATHPEGQESNTNMDVERDWVFNDWIIRISPGKPINDAPEVDYVRVMAEDLGANTSDFDYNDVVFDIKFIKTGDNQYTADIILQAAGGTLPLKIGDREVHDLFGVPTTEMVNTQHGKHHVKAPVSHTVILNGNFNNAWDAINALPIYVQNPNGQVIQLTVNPGSPAEMFAVPVTVDWSDERVPIKDKYPKFVDWIRDSTIQWWEE